MFEPETISNKFLGEDFEFQLINMIIGEFHENGARDIRFGEEIMGLLDDKYFSSLFTKRIVNIIKKYYQQYRGIPTYKEIYAENNLYTNDEIEKKEIKRLLLKISEQKINNKKWIKENVTSFLTQQEILHYCYETISRVKKGDEEVRNLDSLMYNMREFQRKLLQTYRPVVLEPDKPYKFDDKAYYVPLGWGDYFDKKFNFKQGRLALGIIPTGVGKTTTATITAVHNFLRGKVVALVFFEDYYEDIMKKIYAKLSGLGINTVTKNNQVAFELSNEQIKKGYTEGGRLILIKLNQTTATTNDLRNVCDNVIAEYGSLHLLIVDYLDCLNSPKSTRYKDKYEEQADVVIDLITLISDLEYYIPCLTYIQTNRSGLNELIVNLESMGGSVARAFKAQQLFSLSRHRNLEVIKNREGEAGIIYKEIDLDNEKMYIEISESNIDSKEEFVS